VECPNPRIGKYGKMNIISNPKPTKKKFGFLSLFTRTFENGAKNSRMNSLKTPDCSKHFPKNLPHLQRSDMMLQP
jgi:hypothetical protein